jgi:hypothetical protein
MTGAVWQLKVLDELAARGIRGSAASQTLLRRYIAGFESQTPVHTWPLGERPLDEGTREGFDV